MQRLAEAATTNNGTLPFGNMLDLLPEMAGEFSVQVLQTEVLPAEEEPREQGSGTRADSYGPEAHDGTGDSIKLYFRDVHEVKLLSREAEIALARRIERARLSTLRTLARYPFIV